MTAARAAAPALDAAVMVTGASGFIGSRLCASLGRAGRRVRRGASLRTARERPLAPDEVGYDLAAPESELAPLLEGCAAVVHLAGLAHEAGRGRSDADFHAANVVATERLARAAARAGARRFVFVSSAKVFGERSPAGHAYDERDPPRPHGPYAQSKWQAEQVLARVSDESALETVVLRPPLVIGPGVKANFLQLVTAVAHGVPLPFGRVRNARSLLGVDNFVAAIERCLVDGRAAGRTFVVADTPPLSTPELVRGIAAALGVPARLLPVPMPLLAAVARLAGRSAALEKIAGDFVVDPRLLETTLDWQPPVALADVLAQTGAWYRATRGAANPAE